MKKFLFYPIVILLVLEGVSLAQQNMDQTKNYWLNLGVGAGSVGTAGIISLNFQFGEQILTLGHHSNFQLFGSDFWDIGVIYGKQLSNKGTIFTSVGAGLSIVGGTRRTEGLSLFSQGPPPRPINLTLGIPLEMQFIIRPSSAIGIGVCGHININKENPFAGLTLCLQFGKIK